jgi:CHAT domain-containing protein/predicted negative regulator of RcsB-dependent stress response
MQDWTKSGKGGMNCVCKITACLLLSLTFPVSVFTQILEPVVAQTRSREDRTTEALRLYKIGEQQSEEGQYQKALETFQQVLAIVREVRERLAEGQTLNEIGEVYKKLKQYPTSLSFYQQALAIAKEIKNKKLEATTLNEIGELYKDQAQYDKALEVYQQALVDTKEIKAKGLEATILHNIGKVYDKQAQYAKALEAYQQALAIRIELDYKSRAGLTLNSIANIYGKLGQYAKALEAYQKALALFKDNDDKRGQFVAHYNIGELYEKLEQYPKALESYQQAVAIARQTNDKDVEAQTLHKIGEVYEELEQYAKASESYQQAVAIAKEINDKTQEVKLLHNMGKVYGKQAQYDKALEAYQQALAISKEIKNKGLEAVSLHNIGEVYDEQAQYDKALDFFQQALAIRKELDYKSRAGATLNSIGGIYVKLGQYAKALESYQQAFAFFKENNDRAGEFMARGYIALAYKKLGQNSLYSDLAQEISTFSKDADNSTWMEFYQQALAIAGKVGSRLEEGLIYNDVPKQVEATQQDLANDRKAGNKKDEARALNKLGVIYNSQGQYPKALEFFQQALPIYKEIGNKVEQANTLNYIGVTYSNQGQYPQALEFFEQALAIRQEIGDKPGKGQTLNNIGLCYNALEKYANAEKTLFDAIEVWESLRSSGLTDDQKVSMFEIQADTYRFLQSALIAQNKIDAALEIAERGRARAIVELLASKRSGEQPNIATIQPPNLEEIKQVVQQQNATLVQYSIIPEQSLYIWVISPKGKVTFRSFDLKSLRVGATTGGESLQKLVAQTLESLGVGEDRNGIFDVTFPAADPELQTKSLKQLHQLLIQPIADLLPSNPEERIIFIPHQDLFRVPFPALMDSDGKYLVEKHTLLTAPSIQVLELTHKARQKGSRSGQGALVVGNPSPMPPGFQPLLGAEKEALDVAQVLKTKALIGSQATESAVLQQLPNARIIHLATHGTFNEQQPFLSGVALAPDSPSSPLGKGGQQGSDGLLTAEEIFNLNRQGKLTLNAELLVLSACNTGRGRITGDGVIGLSRSFIAAGVPSVLVSLWAVPDAPTASLMTEFYTNLYQKKLDKAQALRQAMLTMMEKYRDTPRAWAAFTLIGETK